MMAQWAKTCSVIVQILPMNSVMHVVWKRVHWCVVVFDGNKAQLF
jgi:hypothetical protein